jgi:hypothetical protein
MAVNNRRWLKRLVRRRNNDMNQEYNYIPVCPICRRKHVQRAVKDSLTAQLSGIPGQLKSDTPRTDSAAVGPVKLLGIKFFECGLVTADFARELERELNEANRRVAAKTALLTDACKRIGDLNKRIAEPSNEKS